VNCPPGPIDNRPQVGNLPYNIPLARFVGQDGILRGVANAAGAGEHTSRGRVTIGRGADF